LSEAVAFTSSPSRPDRTELLTRRFEAPMFLAALLVIPAVVIDVSHVNGGWKTFGLALNWLVWTAFVVELVTMLTVAPDRARWLREHPLEAAIVIFTPPFLPATLQALRLFRLLRLLRLAFVVKITRGLFTAEGLRLAAVIAAVAALGGGAIFSSVEKGNHSLWDGVWWAVTTMSTVGYGDLAPKTVIGRLDAVALMVIGIGFFALLTGAVAQRFLATQAHQDVQDAEAEMTRDVAAARETVLAEIRAISDRLRDLEQIVKRL
jgi:voltage-gated potassium channel